MIVREKKMMILMDVHQKEGVVYCLVVTIMSVLGSPKLEVKGLEEANCQWLQVDFRQANSVAIRDIMKTTQIK